MAEVVVTGIGMVTPLGATAAETTRAWRAGGGAARAPVPELAGTVLASVAVGQLPAFDAAAGLGSRRMLKYMSQAAVAGCVAAREALAEAGVAERVAPERIGLFAGTGLAAAEVGEVLPMIAASLDESGSFSTRELGARGLAQTNPLLSFKILANMPACLVSILEGVRGPSLLFTPWEGQTGAALAEAWSAVASGEVDCALAGAADTPAHPAALVCLRQSGRLRADEYPAPAAAYVVMERARDVPASRVRARLGAVRVTPSEDATRDPLASRLGRTMAAAPAVLLGLACAGASVPRDMVGCDDVRVCFELTSSCAA